MKPWKSSSVRVVLLAALWIGLSSGSSASAQTPSPPRGPSTEPERADALRLVDLLETSPTAAEASTARQNLILWLGQIPDLEVKFCTAILGTAKEVESLPTALALQPMLSQAAFMIRNPQLAPASLEVYVAGLDGAIRAYDAMKLAGGTQELRLFEDLKRERSRGRLIDVVQARIARCK